MKLRGESHLLHYQPINCGFLYNIPIGLVILALRKQGNNRKNVRTSVLGEAKGLI